MYSILLNGKTDLSFNDRGDIRLAAFYSELKHISSTFPPFKRWLLLLYSTFTSQMDAYLTQLFCKLVKFLNKKESSFIIF